MAIPFVHVHAKGHVAGVRPLRRRGILIRRLGDRIAAIGGPRTLRGRRVIDAADRYAFHAGRHAGLRCRGRHRAPSEAPPGYRRRGVRGEAPPVARLVVLSGRARVSRPRHPLQRGRKAWGRRYQDGGARGPCLSRAHSRSWASWCGARPARCHRPRRRQEQPRSCFASVRPRTSTTSIRSWGTRRRPTRSTTFNYDLLVGYRASDGAPKLSSPTAGAPAPTASSGPSRSPQGVKWQDGEPLTAEDVAFTYNYIIKNQLAAYTSYTTNIKKVVALDDTTAQFILSKPKSNMLRLWVPIVPEHIWSKVPGESAGNDYQNNPPIVGSGPFQVVEAKKGEFVRLAANKDYWKGAPHPRRGHLRDLHQSGHHDDGPESGQPRRRLRSAGGAIQCAEERVRAHGSRGAIPLLRSPVHERVRQASLPRESHPQGREVPPGRELGGRQAEDRRYLLRRLRRRR